MVCAGILAAGVGAARADTNQKSIAVPLIGTQGKASLYPSTINLTAHGGLGQTGQVLVALHGVTHPCPEELAILLVHNNAESFLLMSNAGGCRPLQGTTIQFYTGAPAMPNTEPNNPPHPAVVSFDVSNYGAPPIFPSPAPPAPYITAMPPQTTNINGTWSLYVLDTAQGNRGVIAGGWSILYDTSPTLDADQTNVRVPAIGTAAGGAEHYPITFDLSTVPAYVPSRSVTIDVTLHHAVPDNLRMVLQSPEGTSVILMANAGGNNTIQAGTTLRFRDNAAGNLPDANQILTGSYRPGSIYELNVSLGPPAPQMPYFTELAAFEGELARGIWKLWVYDDSNLFIGEIESASLTVSTEYQPDFTFSGQAVPAMFSADQPYVRFEGSVPNEVTAFAFMWRNAVDGEFYDAGAFARLPGTHFFYADVPMKHGTNVVQIYGWTAGNASDATRTVNVSEFTYSLAEGATGEFFDLDITLANPAAADAPITVDFLPENGDVVHLIGQVDAKTPKQFRGDTYVPGAAASTIVRSTSAVPLAVERTMSWDTRGYGGHGGTSVAPSTRWLFAEGSQGYFNTFVLLANDNLSAADVTVDFLLEGGGVVTVPVSVAAKSRHTLFAGDVPAIVNRSFGISIDANKPIIAERAMYLPGPHLLEGGHESAGVNSPSTQWFLAEGATGSFFDCFVLLSNPTPTPVNVGISYLLPDGETIQQPLVLPGNSRHTINVETVDPKLANTAVSITVLSNAGIVVERAMYWPDISQGWVEAHNSFGVTDTALRWGVADGRIGGPRAHQTYILLANPNPVPAEVEVTFLKSSGTVSRNYLLAPTSRVNIWANGDVPELGEGTFSADIRVLNYQPIAVEKALYWDAEGVTWAAGTNVTATRLPPP
jgi:subtilisin-like proprotein convertase family protein